MFPGAVSWDRSLTLRRGHRHKAAARGPLRSCGRLGRNSLNWWLDRFRWRPVALPRRGQLRARSLWQRAHSCRWLSSLRRKCGPLAEVRVLRFAICHELSVDLWQRLVGSARSRNPRIMGAMQSTNRPSPAYNEQIDWLLNGKMWRFGLGIEQRVDFFAPALLAATNMSKGRTACLTIAPVRIEC